MHGAQDKQRLVQREVVNVTRSTKTATEDTAGNENGRVQRPGTRSKESSSVIRVHLVPGGASGEALKEDAPDSPDING